MSYEYLRSMTRKTASFAFLVWASAAPAWAQSELTVNQLSQIVAIQQGLIKTLTDRVNAMDSSKLSKSDASNTYLSTAAASGTYLTKSAATSMYLTKSAAASAYQTSADADATFLTKTAATGRYPTKFEVKNCVLRIGAARGTNSTQPTSNAPTDRGFDNNWNSFSFNYSNDPVELFYDWFCDF